MAPVINVVLPVFGIILCGYLAGRLGILGEASSDAVNRFVYFFALPPLLFIAMARTSVGAVLNWTFIVGYLGGVLLTVVAAGIGALRIWYCDWLAE